MKTIVINASPRKTWNTAEIMQAAQKGAESAGAENLPALKQNISIFMIWSSRDAEAVLPASSRPIPRASATGKTT